QRPGRLAGFTPLEQSGAGVPVVELPGHQRQIDHHQHAVDDPEDRQRARRDQPEEEPVPGPDGIHGRTSFNDANWKRSSTWTRVGAMGSATPIPRGGGSLSTKYRLTHTGNTSAPNPNWRTACRAVNSRCLAYSWDPMLQVNLGLRYRGIFCHQGRSAIRGNS